MNRSVGIRAVTSSQPSKLNTNRIVARSAKMDAMIPWPRDLMVRTVLTLTLASSIVGDIPAVRAQSIPMLPGYLPEKKHKIKDKFPERPSQPPSFTIPVGPFGYAPPGSTYLGRGYSLVNLNFLDENRLLFSFRAPGLLQRETTQDEPEHERQMRAVVLKLPDGTRESETVWTLSDLKPYLWMLKDGHYLLHDRSGLEEGDASLQLKPYLPLAEKLISLEMDPGRNYLLVSSLAPPGTSEKQISGNTLKSKDSSEPAKPTDVVVRLLQLKSAQTIQIKRERAATQTPFNSMGYLEAVHEKLDQWSLKLNAFGGESKAIGHVESTCLTNSFFLSEHEILVAGCDPDHRWKLTAVTTDWRQMWEFPLPNLVVPPLFQIAANGSRFARETISLKQTPQADSETLWVKDVRGQVVRVFDAADGKLALEQPVDPVLDAGGNVAISPSGRRVAVLNKGAIEVFDLPTPAPLPDDVIH